MVSPHTHTHMHPTPLHPLADSIGNVICRKADELDVELVVLARHQKSKLQGGLWPPPPEIQAAGWATGGAVWVGVGGG